MNPGLLFSQIVGALQALKLIRTSLAVAGLSLGALIARAQIIPVGTVSLEAPGVTDLFISLGGTQEHVLPTPFIISPSQPFSAVWFCMDPLQTIFYDGSGLPYTTGNLVYGSTNPADYDLWSSSAPGLNAVRLQMLADLFKAYPPQQNLTLLGGVDQAVALQLAVAEIANELDGNLPPNLATGSFLATAGVWNPSLSTAIIAQAQTFLSSLSQPGIQNQGNIANLVFHIDGGYPIAPADGGLPVQDLVGWSPPTNIPPITPVPESAHFALGAVGLAGLLAVRRWRGGSRTK